MQIVVDHNKWPQDVCEGARFPVEGERCVGSSWSLFKRLEINEEEEEGSVMSKGKATFGNGERKTCCVYGTYKTAKARIWP